LLADAQFNKPRSMVQPAPIRNYAMLKKSKLGNLLKFFRILFLTRRFYEIEFRLTALFENCF
jgi:hypothetical protein